MEEEALDGDACVVDILVARFSLLIADFAAVAVDAVADAVDEALLHAVDLNEGEILNIFVDLNGGIADLLTEVVPEVITGSCREEVERLSDLDAFCVIDEAVESTVTAAEIELVVRI